MPDLLKVQVPTFVGQRNSFLSYEEKAFLRKNVTPLEAAKKAAYLLFRMADVARKARLVVWKDVIGINDGVEQISNISRHRFAPDKVGRFFQDVTKFVHLQRTAREMDGCLLEFDILRQKAESRSSMGTGFPGEFASVLCMQNASLSKNGKCWVVVVV